MMMMLLIECSVFVYEVRMKRSCCWLSVMCLCIKWEWCDDDVVDWVVCVCVWSDDLVEWVSGVCVWSEDDVMILLNECHVFVYEVMIMWWRRWLSVMGLCMKWVGCDDVVDWVSCVCVWSEIDVMMLLSECHFFVYEVRIIWWCCWVSVLCLYMKWGWFDKDV